MHKPLRQTASNQFDRALAILRARRGVSSARGAVGITQRLWGLMSEDRRFYWGLTSRLIAWAAGFLITRTGFRVLDGIVALLGACLAGAVIESQRKYGTLSPRTRKGIIRTAIGVGSWGFTVLGVLLFAAIGAGAFASVVFGALLPTWQHTTDTIG